MLQETLERLMGLDAAATVVVCNENHRFLVAQQFRDLGHEKATIVLESEGKNTAPAITLAALSALAE
jgi:mannose-1-phosphate guanylyltransferase